MNPPPLAHSILDAIGNTPLLELHKLRRSLAFQGRILLKLEYLSPGGSKKDRIAKEILLDAISAKRLLPGQPVVELTSGNTGTGLAIACAALGHPFIAVMSRGNSVERARMMESLGAEVVLVDQATNFAPGQVSGADLALVETETTRICSERRAFRADQFHNLANRLAHERHTGPEIWEQSSGDIDAFVDFAGTAGSFTGVSRALKQRNPSIRCYLAEPTGAATLSGQTASEPRHPIQGGGYAMQDLPLLDRSLISNFVQVSGDDSRDAMRRLARTEGVFGGFSTGANLAAALQLLHSHEKGSTIVIIACDSGMKYLSTDLF